MTTVTVYLLCLDEPLSPRSSSSHYCGATLDLESRLDDHRNRPDARFLQVAKARGISFRLARTWESESWELEKEIKARKELPRLCPFCRSNVGRTRRQLWIESARGARRRWSRAQFAATVRSELWFDAPAGIQLSTGRKSLINRRPR